MGTEKNKHWYNRVYEASSKDKKSTYMSQPEKTYYYETWRKVVEIIQAKGYRAVLDIGCGPGHFGKMCLKNKIGYLGWDFSETAIRMAKKMNPGEEYRFKVCADITTLKDITFPGVVTMTEVLEHIEKDIKVLNAIFCKLLIVTVPSYDYRSHVRFFPTEEDVRKRYEEVIPIEAIYQVPISPKNTIFIIVADYEKAKV